MNVRIVEGAENMALDDVVRLLKMTYWADRRSPEQIERSMRFSVCYGVCPEGSDTLAGFARVITDFATTY